MKYSSLRYIAPLMLGAAVFAMPSLANAGWGHLYGGSSGMYSAAYGSSGYGSGGYSGYGSSGYSSYGSSGYGSSGYGSSGYGSSGRIGLGARIHAHFAAKRARHAARRAARHAYGSSGYAAYYGSSGSSYGSSGYSSYGSSGGSSGYSARSYGSSGYSSSVGYGSSGSSYGSTGSVYYGASKRSSASMSTLASNVEGDEVYLTVNVPADAKIFVNGKPTSSTGTMRQFVSRGLEVEKSYKFAIRAEMTAADGETMVETKTVVASAGESENLQFAFADYKKAIETELVLNVPDGAKVELGGNKTQAVGAQRTYRTTQLSPGDVWDDYKVTVRLGDKVESRSVRLIAGDQLQLTFAFDDSADKLASR